MEILNIFDHLFQSGSDGECAAAWVDTIEHIKDNGLICRILKVALHHSKFIKVCEQSKVICSHNKLSFFVNNNVSL